MLFNFLATRGRDFASASEADLLEFRLWRREQAEGTVGQAAWDRDSAALGQLYDYLVQRGQVPGRPWRPTGRTASLGSGVSRDLRVRRMELEQYLFCRDVGFGGLRPDASLDGTFRGWWPHRNRAACELALMLGVRLQEWSTLPLPELGLTGGPKPATADVDLAACAKYQRPRSVYVPLGAMALMDPYLLLERPRIVAKAQRAAQRESARLRRRSRELFVIQRLDADSARIRGVLDGCTVTRVIKEMDPELRRIAVLETRGDHRGADRVQEARAVPAHRPARPDHAPTWPAPGPRTPATHPAGPRSPQPDHCHRILQLTQQGPKGLIFRKVFPSLR
ncbi:hypothetical protein ACFCWG_17440 [Streptomyces sp. NPDC056390]|uniref:hypothetical protein n=1 Tax=Streptomyces sp. NPDC056390 TaxID=3345806 RepID=UPI0035DC8F30